MPFATDKKVACHELNRYNSMHRMSRVMFVLSLTGKIYMKMDTVRIFVDQTISQSLEYIDSIECASSLSLLCIFLHQTKIFCHLKVCDSSIFLR